MMSNAIRFLVVAGSVALPAILAADTPVAILGGDELAVAEDDWPWWRGPARNGVAAGRPLPPLTWSDTENVVWQQAIEGKGHSSPIRVGDQVFLTTAAGASQILLCFDAATGEPQWRREVNHGGLPPKMNGKSSHASSTPACDGRYVYVNFLNHGAVHTTAYTCAGERRWQTKISNYVVHQGYGASPAVYGDLVLTAADNKSGGVIAALDRETGEVVWQRPRPKLPNYPSPVVLRAAGRNQLLMVGCDLVTSLDPMTGQPFWETGGATTECVATTVTNGNLVFTSGGYPTNHISAVRADGSKEVVWQNTNRVYVPSMVVRDGSLFAVTDAGVAICYASGSGDELWKHRLGGTFSASLVVVNDRIYAANESGTTFVYRATDQGFEQLAKNQLGDQTFATFAISRGQIYARTTRGAGDQRQEWLICLGTRE